MNAKILVVDDHPQNIKLLADLLGAKGYQVVTAACGREALDKVADTHPDLVLLDVMMPGMNGYEVCALLRANPATAMLPVVMVTALDAREERVQGIEAGADDFLSKPINQPELLARVRSLLRIKSLHDTVQAQGAKLAEWNALLEQRVSEQLGQLERLGKLRRFFSPQLAEAIVSGGTDDPLRTHRREVVVVFLDLRGFTAFAETAEPEEVMRVLREYHAEMGELIVAHEGTLERFTGDGMMIFFNDPVIIANPAERALRMAIAMRARVNDMSIVWRKLGYDLGLGIGIAQGFATIGAIGFEGRFDYGAVGTVTNLAARLCSEAASAQILIDHKALAAVENIVNFEEIGEVHLKGFSRPVAAARIVALKAADTSHA
ncbi:MAG: response regulator [Burkholderiales bacterium]|nr:response regulator [Pseudomonadota bacterium]